MDSKIIQKIRLANTVGLDTKNSQHSLALEEAIIGIADVDMFLEYCRDKKDGIQYATKPERLITLAIQFKKIVEEAGRKDQTAKAHSYAGIITEKVKQCRSFVEEMGCGWENIAIKGEKVFEDHQCRALDYLGSVPYVIELSRRNELEDAIMDAYINKNKKKASYESLSNNQKRMKELTDKIRK